MRLERFTTLRGQRKPERTEPDSYYRNRNSPIECHHGFSFYIEPTEATSNQPRLHRTNRGYSEPTEATENLAVDNGSE